MGRVGYFLWALCLWAVIGAVCSQEGEKEVTNDCKAVTKEDGVCVDLAQCPTLQKLMIKPTRASVILLKRSVCKTESKRMLVCCPVNNVRKAGWGGSIFRSLPVPLLPPPSVRGNHVDWILQGGASGRRGGAGLLTGYKKGKRALRYHSPLPHSPPTPPKIFVMPREYHKAVLRFVNINEKTLDSEAVARSLAKATSQKEFWKKL
ncbi:unnamed protein product [Cyprideis torosa]|uniref:Uncharacterized protein n=1 Tax=Cyprideis torosa TaxID=163714 RepID=A0A7R8WS72_9CRUS|nr:unnamed protein product [Cyprideis torosa]CAG0904548.1 unnamed protein product [Cyprideis torosa]